MVRATISADIVSSTALSVEELALLQSEIRRFLDELSEKSQGKDWGRWHFVEFWHRDFNRRCREIINRIES